MTDRSRSCHNQDHESCSGRYAVGRDSRHQLIEYTCRCWCHNEPPVTDRPRPYIKVSRIDGDVPEDLARIYSTRRWP